MKKFGIYILEVVLIVVISVQTFGKASEINDTINENSIPTDNKEAVNLNKAQPGLKTIKNLLLTALEPIGSTMYVYGGGWNEEDTGAGKEAVSIGLSTAWAEFEKNQTSLYNFKDYDYKNDVSVIHKGLDCSGYIGWVLYNTLNTKNGLEGYVNSSKKIAHSLAERGWGTYDKKGEFSDYRAGDIMSSSCDDCAHVWLCVGQCSDGSVVLLHSSRLGPMISGTYTPEGNKNSQAVALASKYMSEYYPQWYERFPEISRDELYLSHYDRFRWDLTGKISDPDLITQLSAQEVLKEIFK